MGTTTLVPTSSTQWQPRDTTAVLSRAHLRASTVNTHPSRDTAAHHSSREATTLSSPNRLTASLDTDTSSPWACSNSPSTSSSSLLRSQAWAAVPVVARAWLVPACVVAPRRPSATASSRRPPHRTYNDLDIHRP